MEKSSKVIATVVTVVGFLLLWVLVIYVMEQSGGSTPGILGLIVFAIFVAILRAIWKKTKEDK